MQDGIAGPVITGPRQAEMKRPIEQIDQGSRAALEQEHRVIAEELYQAQAIELLVGTLTTAVLLAGEGMRQKNNN